MKTIYAILISMFAAATLSVSAQDYPEEYLGLPGDNLNLYAVMNLFQQSETLEGFERSLNDEESMINNLDLNGDRLIDYITVSDFLDGDIHSIVMRAALNRNEQQDIAVFIVEQLRNGQVQIQLIGDEALYGPNYIVEPIYAERANPGYTGKAQRRNEYMATSTYYDIAAWPLIRSIYHPRYVVWRSSWYWDCYPTYWRPWRAHYWHYYYGYHYQWHDHYYGHYRHWDHYRSRHYHNNYHSHVRVYSPTVVVNINKNRYMSTYSRPERQNAGAERYARTANRSGTINSRQGVQRTSISANRTRESVSTNRRNTTAVRNSATPRTTRSSSSTVRTNQQNSRSAVRPSSQRSSNQKRVVPVQNSRSTNTSTSTRSRSSAVQRSSQQNRSNASVSRNSSQKSSPSVQRSSNQRSTPSAQRSSSQRSTPSAQRSSSQRSTPSVQRSSSQRSTPSVQRSSSRKSTPSVQRSSSRKSTPSVQRSSSRKSTPSVQRSSSSRSSAQRSSSSRNSGGSQRTSSSSRR